jgi:hypothetical protein
MICMIVTFTACPRQTNVYTSIHIASHSTQPINRDGALTIGRADRRACFVYINANSIYAVLASLLKTNSGSQSVLLTTLGRVL